MNLFSVFRRPDMEKGLASFRQTPGAVLLDVRTEEEYRQGHIPGSVNLPLQKLRDIDQVVMDPDTAIFVYCHSGARSSQAVELLRDMGYEQVENIGGIAAYTSLSKKP